MPTPSKILQMEFEDDPLVQMGVAGALSKELRQDHEMFIQFFAKALQSAFPNESELKFEGGFLSKKRLAGVSIQLGDDVYSLFKPARGPMESTRTHVIRGIALKTEPIPVDQWLADISAAIEEKVGKDSHARSALAQALGLS